MKEFRAYPVTPGLALSKLLLLFLQSVLLFALIFAAIRFGMAPIVYWFLAFFIALLIIGWVIRRIQLAPARAILIMNSDGLMDRRLLKKPIPWALLTAAIELKNDKASMLLLKSAKPLTEYFITKQAAEQVAAVTQPHGFDLFIETRMTEPGHRKIIIALQTAAGTFAKQLKMLDLKDAKPVSAAAKAAANAAVNAAPPKESTPAAPSKHHSLADHPNAAEMSRRLLEHATVTLDPALLAPETAQAKLMRLVSPLVVKLVTEVAQATGQREPSGIIRLNAALSGYAARLSLDLRSKPSTHTKVLQAARLIHLGGIGDGIDLWSVIEKGFTVNGIPTDRMPKIEARIAEFAAAIDADNYPPLGSGWADVEKTLAAWDDRQDDLIEMCKAQGMEPIDLALISATVLVELVRLTRPALDLPRIQREIADTLVAGARAVPITS